MHSGNCKFQLKLTNLIFCTKFARKGDFRFKTEKCHFCVRPWSFLTIFIFFTRQIGRGRLHFNSISMFFSLLVAETTNLYQGVSNFSETLQESSWSFTWKSEVFVVKILQSLRNRFFRFFRFWFFPIKCENPEHSPFLTLNEWAIYCNKCHCIYHLKTYQLWEITILYMWKS